MPSTATTFWDHSLQIDLNLMKQMEKINKAIKQHLMSASRLNLVLLQHLNRFDHSLMPASRQNQVLLQHLVRPFPKAAARKAHKDGRKRAATRIITDTPVKNAPENELQARSMRKIPAKKRKLNMTSIDVRSYVDKLSTNKTQGSSPATTKTGTKSAAKARKMASSKGLMFNGIWILDLAADSDRRIEMETGEEGDLKLETKPLRPLYSLLSFSNWRPDSDSLPDELREEKRIRDQLSQSKESEDDLISTSDPGCAYEDETGDADCIQMKSQQQQQTPDSADSFIQPTASSNKPHPSNSSSREEGVGRGGGGGLSEVVIIVSPPSHASESTIAPVTSAAAAVGSTSSDDDETRRQREKDGVSKTRQCPLEDDKDTAAADVRRCSSSSSHQSQPPPPLAHSLQSQSVVAAGTKKMMESTSSASTSITLLPPHTSHASTPPPTLKPSPNRPVTSHPSRSPSTAHLGPAPMTASTHPPGYHRPPSPEGDHSTTYGPLHPVSRDLDSEPDMGQRSSLEYGLVSLTSLTMNIALTVGIVCGTVVLISVTIYALVRCGRPRGDPACYKADPSSKYVYEACETTQATPIERVGITPTPPSEQRTNPHKKYVNEWYV